MDATTLAAEATRYLEAIDLLRSLGLEVKWRSEADEARVLSPPGRAAATSPMQALRRPVRTDQRATRLLPDVNQRQKEHHDVNAEAHDTPGRVRCRLTAALTGCA
jgi:hypothetical protein